jgi:hypothetical protein
MIHNSQKLSLSYQHFPAHKRQQEQWVLRAGELGSSYQIHIFPTTHLELAMANRSERVLARVTQAMHKDPALTTRALYDLATEVDEQVRGLSLRQFNASYVLPVRRKPATVAKPRKSAARSKTARAGRAARTGLREPSEEGATRSTSEPSGHRETVRAVFLRFASEFSEAESRSEIVGVLANIDRYVDEVLQTCG